MIISGEWNDDRPILLPQEVNSAVTPLIPGQLNIGEK
ncbi:hypothetical protein SPAB_02695 [Salmonella enterica subsp. enterica serovar Paratyphi B str. SPB7]|uniref:Uncharacterized protein n=1 Tax=Salmonella paratyphi B (strain ATCC BAA-1250 / SPB7) TaxID=1016998 RepID=A0A6C6Z378_SALPB|nr:hypothetical protein SPAB_02695 [Salmonella enterica subsp. enterica serovar Paratyphi B str. SPB7]